MTATAYDRLVDALHRHGSTVKANGVRASATCPAHDDSSPSLSLTRTESQALIHCHAGCDAPDVLAALDLTMTDLFDEPKGATYTYTDLNGAPTRYAHRSPAKRFWQTGDTKGTAQLYRLPAVAAAVAAGAPVYLVEGEKDVHALETLGVVATTSPMGAANWEKCDPSPLEGARVIVVPDRDEAGRKYAADVVNTLQKIAGTVEIKIAKVGKDAADHIAAGYGLDDLEPGELPATPTTTGVAGATWQAVDLTPYLDGTHVRAEATVGLARKDEVRLLYPGKEHTVIGEMEAGKSWFALGCVAAELVAGHRVVYCHFEESDPSDTVERLQLLGVDDHLILTNFAFTGPNEPVDEFALAALLDPTPSLVVIDGVNECMSLHGQGIRDEDGAAAFRRRLVKPCTAVGAAVLSCDHVVKDREARGRGPLGSIHKGNGLTGSLILLENVSPFGRGERGCSRVFITKDRPGYLRRHGKPDRKMPGKTFMGSLIVDDTRTWVLEGVDLAFLEPQPDAEVESAGPLQTRDAQDDERVLSVVAELAELDIQATGRSVRVRSGISKERTADALTRLVLDQKLCEVSGPRGARIYSGPKAPSSGPSGPDLKDRGPLDHSNDRSRDRSGPVGTAQGEDAP